MRLREATETLALLQPWLQPLGISRITDVTRLDRLGLPVFASVRPRGRLLRVHAGKSIDPMQARVSAAMEAVELAVAEAAAEAVTKAPPRPMTLRAWAGHCPKGLQLRDFAPNPRVQPHLDQPVAMAKAHWMGARRQVLLPAALIHPIQESDAATSLFPWSSTGLASGNSLAEATLHALLEVLERDTQALHRAHDESAWLAPNEWPAPVTAWAEAWAGWGVHLLVRHLPNEFGMPCFSAWLHEPGSLDVNLAGGTALHLDAQTALMKAVAEAAQSRLSTLHGGREDVNVFYDKYALMSPEARQTQEASLLAQLTSIDRQIRWADVPNQPARTVAQALAWTRRRLAECGFPWVFVSRLRAPGLDIRPLEVVKLVVPRCEALEHGAPRLGPRLARRALKHAA